MRIDLHAHTAASDGTAPAAELPRMAAAAGVDVVAVTDHDTVDGLAAAAAAVPAGVTVVPGAEISCACEVAGRRVSVHLLGYLFDPAEPSLAAELAALRTDRDTRARRMVDLLRCHGAPVTWEQVAEIAGAAPVGRPHIAAALAAAGVVADPAAAFTAQWIGSGGRAHVAKHASDPALVVGLVRRAGGVAVLAHPAAGRQAQLLDDDAIRRIAAAGLAGLEVDHPEHDAPARARLRRLADDLGLLVTGGSDFHGARKRQPLGAETTDPAVYQALVAAATGGAPVAA